jgi:hypothetical protein
MGYDLCRVPLTMRHLRHCRETGCTGQAPDRELLQRILRPSHPVRCEHSAENRSLKNKRVEAFDSVCASGTSVRSARLRYVCLLKTPFLLQQLTLRPTMDAPRRGGVGAVIRKANMCVVT